jgi:beta-galactosidase
MKMFSRTLLVLSIVLAFSANSQHIARADETRREFRADASWKFLLGDPAGAEAPFFADASWRSVDLPHDWSIESAPDQKNLTGAGGGFFPGGIGWYRKTFTAAASWKGHHVGIEFDGVASNATVYLNGQKLGIHPYAYTSFAFDLTPQLKLGQTNVLAVRVDCTELPNSRWYSGAGIYRHVRVVVADPTHVAHWGIFVTTPEASSSSSKVSVRTRVANESADETSVLVETSLLDRVGKKVGTTQSPLKISAGTEIEATQDITVTNPALWSPETPAMYRAVSRILQNGKPIDEVVTPFGIRTLAWSAEKGLLLNGKSIKLTGGSVHHDNGLLGAAAFDRAEERRVQLLKAAGHNAVRTAHNPPSPAFLDACDRFGLLVLDEPFDVWKASKAKFDYGRNFDEWWQRDISSMVLRDRNHPSIVIWGIGNEIPELAVDRGPTMAKPVVELVRSLDSTRPLTLAFPGTTTAPSAAAVFSTLDITGYNYSLDRTFADDHSRVPSRLMLTTESYPAKAFQLWKISQENPYILGDLTWTAMDYLGESGIGAWSYTTPEQAEKAEKAGAVLGDPSFIDKLFLAMANGVDIAQAMGQGGGDKSDMSALMLLFHGYPWHAANCGDIDLTGYRKPQSYYRDIVWNHGDRVYATVRLPEPEGKKIVAIGWAVYPTLPNWTWPGQEGKPMQVEVYSGADSARLYLNDKLIEEKPTGKDQEFIATFDVAYAPGKLRAEGLRSGRVVAKQEIITTGAPMRLKLTADRKDLSADGQDLAFVTIEAVDGQGRLQFNADQQVHFTLSGPGAIAGLGNGDGQSAAPYQGDMLTLFHGRALVVVRTSRASGSIRLSAASPGLGDAFASLTSKPNAGVPELP